jgi:hypothetical protein
MIIGQIRGDHVLQITSLHTLSLDSPGLDLLEDLELEPDARGMLLSALFERVMRDRAAP